MGDVVIPYEKRTLAAPGPGVNFPVGGFGVSIRDAGLVITIDPTLTTDVSLVSFDGAVTYVQKLGTAPAGTLTPFVVPSAPRFKPGTATVMLYFLQIATDSIVRTVTVAEHPTWWCSFLANPAALGAQIAAAIVANPPPITVTVSDIDALNPVSVNVIPAAATVAQNRWSAAVSFPFGSTISGIVRSIEVIGDKNTGAVLADCSGDVGIFSADPGLAANTQNLTAAQAKLLIGQAKFDISELVTDANTFRFTGVTSIPFGSTSALFIAFFSRGLTSFGAAQTLDVRLGVERLS